MGYPPPPAPVVPFLVCPCAPAPPPLAAHHGLRRGYVHIYNIAQQTKTYNIYNILYRACVYVSVVGVVEGVGRGQFCDNNYEYYGDDNNEDGGHDPRAHPPLQESRMKTIQIRVEATMKANPTETRLGGRYSFRKNTKPSTIFNQIKQ